MAEGLRDEIAVLKNVVNQQKLDKAELEALILSQRYTEHPGNVARPPLLIPSTAGIDYSIHCFYHILYCLVVTVCCITLVYCVRKVLLML